MTVCFSTKINHPKLFDRKHNYISWGGPEMEDWSSFLIISSAVIATQMPLPVFLFQLLPQLSWICAATPAVQMVEASKHWLLQLLQLIQAFTLIGLGLTFFFPLSLSFWVSVRKRRQVAATGTTSALLRAPQLRGWGLYANIAVTKSSGNMNSTQMCTYPCGKVRRKRPVRFVEAHSLQCTHMSKHAAFGLDPGRTDKGTLWELPITQTSRKSWPQTVQWLVGVEDTARKGGWGREKKCPFNQPGNQLITTKSLFSLMFSLCSRLTWLLLQKEWLSAVLSPRLSHQNILNHVCGLAF